MGHMVGDSMCMCVRARLPRGRVRVSAQRLCVLLPPSVPFVCEQLGPPRACTIYSNAAPPTMGPSPAGLDPCPPEIPGVYGGWPWALWGMAQGLPPPLTSSCLGSATPAGQVTFVRTGLLTLLYRHVLACPPPVLHWLFQVSLAT